MVAKPRIRSVRILLIVGFCIDIGDGVIVIVPIGFLTVVVLGILVSVAFFGVTLKLVDFSLGVLADVVGITMVLCVGRLVVFVAR